MLQLLKFIPFFVSILLVYGGMHFYAYYKIQKVINLSGLNLYSAISIATVFMFLPFLSRILEHKNYLLAAQFTSLLGFVWMGYIFLFFWTSLGIDIFLFWWQIPEKIHLKITLILSLLIMAYGFIEAGRIRILTYKIPVPKTKLNKNIRMVQISDLHLGLSFIPSRGYTVVEKIKSLNPDVIVSTGDFIDSKIRSLKLVNAFRDIKPPLGKFAVTGNHEFYTGISYSKDIHSKAGFKLLRQECASIDKQIVLAGVDDPAVKKYGPAPNEDFLKTIPPSAFTILLKHRPMLNDASLPFIDLQLSGHVHNGQIFPFGIFTHLAFPFKESKLIEIKGITLYVSQGTGSWGPPIRFLAPPEITCFDFYPS